MEQKNEAVVREERVSMTIALSPEDKRFLKVYAAEHDVRRRSDVGNNVTVFSVA